MRKSVAILYRVRNQQSGTNGNIARRSSVQLRAKRTNDKRIRRGEDGQGYRLGGNECTLSALTKRYASMISCYYKEEYTGGNNPPDCGSMDGRIGIEAESGEIKQCADCEFNKFGSGKNGAKACKQKRRIYLLREGEALPIILSLPTGSLAEFSKYVMRLLSKGKKTVSVVTKFTLKKAQNSGGINYSQAVFAVDRNLTEEELKNVLPLAEQVKAMATKVTALDEE